MNDEFHVLSDFGNRLEGIVYYEAERILEFKYSYIDINRIYRRKNLDVRVPVPATEEAQLQKVLKHFGE